jgi:molybdopterin-binding protein
VAASVTEDRPGHQTLPSHTIRRTGGQKEKTMKLSARNQIKGKVASVHKGATTAHVQIDIGGGVVVTASITNEAVDELGISSGKDVIAVIKASDVMVGV